MKLKNFQNNGFEFSLLFANGDNIIVNLRDLIGEYVSESDLSSAVIDSEWGCIEFCNGNIDIEPSTLYHYALKNGDFNKQSSNKSLQTA
ncbi:MAG: DUF2442 domain-containing protein [Chlorobium sp.]